MTLPWLADVLRDAGLRVVEHPNWKTHDRPGDWSPRYGVVHATAAPRSQADDVQVRVVRDGRSDLPGPIANAVLTRDGVWHVVSAGRCNSTLVGTAGPYEGLGNTYALSVEGCNDNLSEPWGAGQYQSYVRGWAAWCRRLGWTARNLVGHKEHTPGHKTDPTFNMDRFRADVTAVLNGDDDMAMSDDDRKALAELHADVRKILTGGMSTYPDGRPENALFYWLRSIADKADPILRTGAYAKFPPITGPGLAQVGRQLSDIEAREVARDAAMVQRFLDSLPAGSDPVTREELESALYNTFGRAFGPAPTNG